MSRLRKKGVTALQLKEAGFSASNLRLEFTLSELKEAGYSALELKESGCNALELKQEGYSALELKKAGFFAYQLQEIGYSDLELEEAGYSMSEINIFHKKQDKDINGLKQAEEIKNIILNEYKDQNIKDQIDINVYYKGDYIKNNFSIIVTNKKGSSKQPCSGADFNLEEGELLIKQINNCLIKQRKLFN